MSSVFWSQWLLLLLLSFHTVHALFEDEAGKFDFVVSTTGHGPVNFVSVVDPDWMITSDSPANPKENSNNPNTSCYVACRKASTGALVWRRNVCTGSSTNSKRRHVTTVVDHVVVTVDVTSGVVQGWDVKTGALLWDATIETKNHKDHLSVWSLSSGTVVIVETKKRTYVFDVKTGKETEKPAGNPPAVPSKRAIFCDAFHTHVEVVEDGTELTAKHSESTTIVRAPLNLSSTLDTVTALTMVQCDKTFVSTLVTTAKGSTKQITFTLSSDPGMMVPSTVWTAEESLAQASSAILLDASHDADNVDIVVEQDNVAQTILSFSHRLQLQYKSILSMMDGSFLLSNNNNRREHDFGFVKVAVVLTPHKLIGLDTTGTGRRRGGVRYQLDLPSDAAWHKMVHGAANARTAAHGINGGAHTREVLVLSSVPTKNEIHYVCLDGTNGAIHAVGSVPITSEILQIIPLAAASASSSSLSPCRQTAVLLLQDHSLVSVPPSGTDPKASAARSLLAASSSTTHDSTTPHYGFYTHVIDSQTSQFQSYGFIGSSSSSDDVSTTTTPQLVGTAAFPGEQIIHVAYPNREEVVQRPCHVLGDDSLLLKYLNPHLVVVVTMATDEDTINDGVLTVFKGKAIQTSKKPKRKPAGVDGTAAAGAAADTTTTTEEAPTPNLFINVMDSVSGRIIYRASHAYASIEPKPCVLISENWIFYTYLNRKTRRAEIGVLSLYEGMIEPKGLNVFTNPDQLSSFSSLDARETKPVVLAKTYTMSKAITALGITFTRGGISGRRLLMATADGQVHSVDRKVLEPRRPLGEVKEHEKKEGLHKYNELIPVVSFQALSYNQTIEGVKSIVTAPTDLESQTLVLALGGPDIFFTRISPSRGFDLLPDSFSRGVLSIVVVALCVILLVVKQMGSKKILKQGWT